MYLIDEEIYNGTIRKLADLESKNRALTTERDHLRDDAKGYALQSKNWERLYGVLSHSCQKYMSAANIANANVEQLKTVVKERVEKIEKLTLGIANEIKSTEEWRTAALKAWGEIKRLKTDGISQGVSVKLDCTTGELMDVVRNLSEEVKSAFAVVDAAVEWQKVYTTPCTIADTAVRAKNLCDAVSAMKRVTTRINNGGRVADAVLTKTPWGFFEAIAA